MNHEASSPIVAAARSHDFPQTAAAIAAGVRLCRQQAKAECGDWLWMIGNLPKAQHDAICCWLSHWLTGWDRLCHPPHEVHITQDSCGDLRDALDDAFLGRNVPVDVLARAATFETWGVPKQFCFEIYDGVDRLLRFPPVADWDELLVIGSKIGGAGIAGLLAILDVRDRTCEALAMRLGQAFWITLALSTVSKFSTPGLQLLDQTTFKSFGLNAAEAWRSQTELPWMQWVRWHCQRIEPLLANSSELLQHLDFDGVRVFRYVYQMLWHLNVRWRLQPSQVWQPGAAMTDKDLFGYRTRFFLGLDPELPFVSTGSGHHH